MFTFQDLHYFSDSEHQSGGASGLVPRQELRRLRNRTLSGLDSLRLGEQARERSHSLTIGGLPQGPRTPCTPTFATEKDAITNFVDFNPAGKVRAELRDQNRKQQSGVFFKVLGLGSNFPLVTWLMDNYLADYFQIL